MTRAKKPADPEPLPPSAAAKALLIAELNAQGLRPVDLAERLGITRQLAHRLLDVGHATKIDTIDEALRALGRRLTLAVEDC